MRKIVLLLIMTILLASCSWKEPSQASKKQEKKDFYIKTQLVSEFWNSAEIKKTWKIMPSSVVNVSAKANWQVDNILVREWDDVKKWQVLAKLSDSISNYYLKLQNAKNNLESARLNLESTQISLDKAVQDAQLNLEKAQSNYNIAQQDADQSIKSSEKNLEQMKINLDNSNLSQDTSKASLDLEKAKQSLEKQELDYQNKLNSDKETIDSFMASTKEQYSNLKSTNDDILTFADELLWVSDLNENENDIFEDYLWAKDTNKLQETKDKLRNLLKKKENTLSTDLDNLTIDNLTSRIQELDNTYKELISLLDDIEYVLNHSVTSSSFSSTMINGYLAQVDGFQANINGKYTGYVSFKSQVSSFLNTYKQLQESLKKGIELTKKDIQILENTLNTQSSSSNISYDQAKINHEKTVLALKDKLQNLEIAVKNAENNFENAKKNKQVTIKQLKNAISSAEVSYSEMADQVNKLTVTSPIDGKISKVNIDLWQDVYTNTSMFELIQWDTTEIQTSLNQNELDIINKDQPVHIVYNNKNLTWTIYSISDLANNNLSYDVKVKLINDSWFFWDVVDVYFPIQTKNKLLPLNIIQTWDESSWIVYLYKNNSIVEKKVELWKTYGKYMEVLTPLTWNVITSNIDNFDETKYKLQVKNSK